MGRSRRLALGAVTVVVLGAVACTAGDPGATTPGHSSPSASPRTTAAAALQPYQTHEFRPAMTVQPPSWLPPEPTSDEEHFLTWTGEGADVDRAVRFVSPVGLYDPGHRPGRLSPLPRDYVAYLRGLTRFGAEISKPTEIKVDGHRATLLTATTTDGMDGSLGCKAPDLLPADCFGLQDFAVLHLAVFEVNGTLVLAWARVVPGAPYTDQDFAAFEELLGSVRFR